MKFKLIAALLPIAMAACPTEASDSPSLKIAFTTDVHGAFFPYDFITLNPAAGSMARVATAIDSLRADSGADNVLLLDNGDILQGQPTVYYFNFINTSDPHIAAGIYQFLGYDAATIGNHDIETGHPVYDRWIAGAGIPVLGANVIDRHTGRPYLKPYTIVSRGGLKIAILGLLTPAIPAWLPEKLWEGLEFQPMVEAARHWLPIIKEQENPDLIIGLFHSGADESKTTAGIAENASLTVAREVPGFNAVLFGHDHRQFCDSITATDGSTVYLLNPANAAMNIGILTVNPTTKSITPSLLPVADLQPSEAFMARFSGQLAEVDSFVNRQIAVISDTITTRDAFFGPSAFMTLLHRLQLDITGADISMAAPLTFDGMIAKGPLRIADMFTLYKYENMLCTLRLTGREIRDYLEFSYSQWLDPRPLKPGSHLVYFDSDSPTLSDNRLRNPSYNFDSAAGIRYTVDPTQPVGKRVNIIAMASGEPFDLSKTYTVAVNSYRAGGGGDHLTCGAGIAPSELKKRIVSSTEKDLRFYLIKQLEKEGHITPEVDRNWHFVDSPALAGAIDADRHLLFGAGSSKNQK